MEEEYKIGLFVDDEIRKAISTENQEEAKECIEKLNSEILPDGKKISDYIIVECDAMVPQNDDWADLIEKCYGDKAKKVTRYAIKKQKDIFDVNKLEQAVLELPNGYELRLIEEAEYELCQNNRWANDLVSQFKDYDTYKKLGLGVVVLKDEELVSGASSYSRYNEGIEIEIDTREDHRISVRWH